MNAQSHNLASVVRNSSSLVGITAALWLVLAGPVFWWKGPLGLEGLSYAALLCLVPGCIVFLLSTSFVVREKPATELLLPLVATILRLLCVLMGVLLIRQYRPDLGFSGFLVWVIVFYFATLAAETWILLKKRESFPVS